MEPLHIGIDYRPALSRMTGVGRYVSGLVRGLLELGSEEHRYTLFSSSLRERLRRNGFPSHLRVVDRRIPVRLLNWLWHRWGWPPLDELIGSDLDVAHSPHPLILPSRRARSVITIHDLYFYRHPETVLGEIRRDYPSRVEDHARRADVIITVSRATAADVEATLGVSQDRIAVTPPGVDLDDFRKDHESDVAARYHLPPEYALAVATVEPRKNLPRLLEAVSRLVSRGWAGSLVLAGGPGGDERRVAETMERLAIGARVVRLDYVPPRDLPALYRGARLLVTPSLWEGFGLPVLEAMASGVAVVASDIPAHREVAGSAALYVDPGDPDAIAAGIERVWSDREQSRRLTQAGRDRAPLFSWRETAVKTLAVYERLRR
jgi:glycosyltransferase involved in cell wall biosynthesis